MRINIAVHDYQTVNLDIVRAIIENHIDDLKGFSKLMLNLK
ncbi:HepT-like ribonuclease domain-containing protein [Clostridium sp. Mt-5]|uniref:HepT-like ribonuclease domain-containing protein n=1 Tax=Clostridium moutaii TaxID=3240932 RepID=A0ABV4BJ13_9CLOT